MVETSPRPAPIAAAATSTAAFVGPTLTGVLASMQDAAPSSAPLLTSFEDFERLYGGTDDLLFADQRVPNYVAHAACVYFLNGGTRLYVLRVSNETAATMPVAADYQAALETLTTLPDVSIVAAPGYSAHADAQAIQAALIGQVESGPLHQFAVLDAPPHRSAADMQAIRGAINSKNSAIYYPWVTISNPGAGLRGAELAEILVPPSGFVCGIFARNDREYGVWKAAGNQHLEGGLRLEQGISHAEQDQLSEIGVNCLRTVPGEGLRIWGARTTSTDPEWKYVNRRRYFMYLQDSIERGLRWVVFEPNGAKLWVGVCRAVTDFLYSEWQRGAFAGSQPDEAFFVRCDHSTMSQRDLEQGRCICLLGVAMAKPAEFGLIRIELTAQPDV